VELQLLLVQELPHKEMLVVLATIMLELTKAAAVVVLVL
jgi:hypothetical protein